MDLLKGIAPIVSMLLVQSSVLASELPVPKPQSAPSKSTPSPRTGPKSAAPKAGGGGGKELVNNGSFEYPVQAAGWMNFAAPTNNLYAWQVSKGNVDLFHCNTPYGTQAVDLEGQEAGTIRQGLRTVPGVKYDLRLCAACHPMGGGPDKRFFVRAAGQAKSWAFDCSQYDGREDLGWRQIDWQFIAHEPITVLEIGSMRPDGTGGAMIDAVSVMRAGTRPAKPSGEKSAASAASAGSAGSGGSSSSISTGGQTDAAQKNLIVNGSFEQSAEPGSGWLHHDAGSTAINGWRVVLGDIDLWGGIKTPFGKKTIDLQGQQAGAVAQTIPTVTGATYRLKFWVGSYDENSKKVYARVAGKKQIWPITVTGSTEHPCLAEVSFDFKARDVKTNIEIGSYTNGTQGPVIDNVSCIKIADPVKVESPSAGSAPSVATPPVPTTQAATEEEEEEEEEATSPTPAASPATPSGVESTPPPAASTAPVSPAPPK